MIPASMGLRFQVPPDLVSFTITASWITYETVEAGGDQGRPYDSQRDSSDLVPASSRLSGCDDRQRQGLGGFLKAVVVGNQRGQWCNGSGGLSSG